jgi:hypothetical protein
MELDEVVLGKSLRFGIFGQRISFLATQKP